MKVKMKKLLTYILFICLSFVLVYGSVLGSVDKAWEDRLFHQAGTIDTRIKIIKIDDRTMNQLGEYANWNRDVYAELLETLCVSDTVRPAVVGFDILFSGERDEASDLRFAKAAQMHGNVVIGFSYVFTKELVSDEHGNLFENGMAVQEVVNPYRALKEATTQGFVNALMDEDDGIIRSSLLYYVEDDGTVKKSFSATLYERYMESQGREASYPTDKNGLTFRYSGNPGEYENVSLIDVLNGVVPAKAFDDCIVLVGAYAKGMMDAYFVPVDASAQMYGVEIQANVIQALLEGKMLTNLPKALDVLIAIAVVVLLVFLCERSTVAKVVAICTSTIAVKFLAQFLLFRMGYMCNVLGLPITVVLIGIYYVGLHYYSARAQKRSIEKAFSKYVAPQVVAEIAKNGTYELKLGGEKRDVAVLFVDIRGFTTLSESLAPEQVVEILNGYLALTTECIFRYGGTLDKFIGDATMAVFNAPFDTEDYVYKAILTAWDIVQGGNQIEKECMEKFGKSVGFGVGVHCGPAIVGNIGCDFRMDYTAIGDTVNTAARLEANAPRSTVYISSEVYEQVRNRITVEAVGEIPLKGKSNVVFVYAVTGVTKNEEGIDYSR